MAEGVSHLRFSLRSKLRRTRDSYLKLNSIFINNCAERVGFEPTETLLPQQFSRLPHSTTLAPLRTVVNAGLMTSRPTYSDIIFLSYLAPKNVTQGIFLSRLFTSLFFRQRRTRLRRADTSGATCALPRYAGALARRAGRSDASPSIVKTF